MIELVLFFASFVSVFALGFQSLNVNKGHYRAAFVTGFAISAGQLFLYRLIPDASLTEIGAYMLGGPFGIICSMWAHEQVFSGMPRREAMIVKLKGKKHAPPLS
jgi:hypothetical protein